MKIGCSISYIKTVTTSLVVKYVENDMAYSINTSISLSFTYLPNTFTLYLEWDIFFFSTVHSYCNLIYSFFLVFFKFKISHVIKEFGKVTGDLK